MKVSKEDVVKIAHLARLDLKESKVGEMQDSINKVLDWMEADQSSTTLSREKALALGPDTNEQYFKVPQVIE